MVGISLSQFHSHSYINCHGMARATTAIFQAADMTWGATDFIRKLLLAEAVHTAPKLEKATKGRACICLYDGNWLLLFFNEIRVYGSHPAS